MKKLLFLMLALSSSVYSQDTLKTKFSHEFGANTTSLIKQILSLSANNFQTLPYDLTYKLRYNNCALRAGAGFIMNNTEATSTTTSITSSPNPNPQFPDVDETPATKTESNTISFRIGAEKIVQIDKRFSASIGFDIIGQRSKSFSISSFVSNNLPNFYNFSKTTDESKTIAIGAGPVAGLQFKINKRFSLFTELPVYFQRGKETGTTVNYSNSGQQNFQNGNIVYTSRTVTKTETITTNKVNIFLPVTVYLAITF